MLALVSESACTEAVPSTLGRRLEARRCASSYGRLAAVRESQAQVQLSTRQ